MLPRRQPQPTFRNRIAVADWTNGPATNIVPLASASARSPVIAPGYGIEPWHITSNSLYILLGMASLAVHQNSMA